MKFISWVQKSMKLDFKKSKAQDLNLPVSAEGRLGFDRVAGGILVMMVENTVRVRIRRRGGGGESGREENTLIGGGSSKVTRSGGNAIAERGRIDKRVEANYTGPGLVSLPTADHCLCSERPDGYEVVLTTYYDVLSVR